VDKVYLLELPLIIAKFKDVKFFIQISKKYIENYLKFSKIFIDTTYNIAYNILVEETQKCKRS